MLKSENNNTTIDNIKYSKDLEYHKNRSDKLDELEIEYKNLKVLYIYIIFILLY